MLSGDAPGAVAVFFLEAVEPVESLVLGRGTSDCRYEQCDTRSHVVSRTTRLEDQPDVMLSA